MAAKIINLTERIESQENALWDRRARALGFRDFAALEAANNAEFDEQFEWLQANCTHPDKHPDLGMCENCAELLPP
jgi:hypothetical protein